MPKAKAKKKQETTFTTESDLMQVVETLLGRPLKDTEIKEIAYSAKEFVKHNFKMMDVYDFETLKEEAIENGIVKEEEEDDGDDSGYCRGDDSELGWDREDY